MKYKLVCKEYLDGYKGYFVHDASVVDPEKSLIYPTIKQQVSVWSHIDIRGMSKEHCLEYIKKRIKNAEDSKKYWTVVETTEEFV